MTDGKPSDFFVPEEKMVMYYIYYRYRMVISPNLDCEQKGIIFSIVL